uniref:Uncharacterized protein n=1 Tax=Meloidogyne enterolobii TaxID=390850 RepID=A0A6V7U5P4_MELEN|nr:unnamed protein product [Meloidogyne enterolobii]
MNSKIYGKLMDRSWHTRGSQRLENKLKNIINIYKLRLLRELSSAKRIDSNWRSYKSIFL